MCAGYQHNNYGQSFVTLSKASFMKVKSYVRLVHMLGWIKYKCINNQGWKGRAKTKQIKMKNWEWPGDARG